MNKKGKRYCDLCGEIIPTYKNKVICEMKGSISHEVCAHYHKKCFDRVRLESNPKPYLIYWEEWPYPDYQENIGIAFSLENAKKYVQENYPHCRLKTQDDDFLVFEGDEKESGMYEVVTITDVPLIK